MWTDAYKFCEENFNTTGTEEEWAGICKQMVELANKHYGHGLMNNLLLAVFDWMSDEERKQRSEQHHLTDERPYTTDPGSEGRDMDGEQLAMSDMR